MFDKSQFNINKVADPNWLERIVDFFISHKVLLICMLLFIVSIGFICVKEIKNQPTTDNSDSSFSNIEIEGYYYGRFNGKKSEGFPARIIRENNSDSKYILYFHNGEYGLYYDRLEGLLQSEQLGIGVIAIDNKKNNLIIEFKEWIFKR